MDINNMKRLDTCDTTELRDIWEKSNKLRYVVFLRAEQMAMENMTDKLNYFRSGSIKYEFTNYCHYLECRNTFLFLEDVIPYLRDFIGSDKIPLAEKGDKLDYMLTFNRATLKSIDIERIRDRLIEIIMELEDIVFHDIETEINWIHDDEALFNWFTEYFVDFYGEYFYVDSDLTVYELNVL